MSAETTETPDPLQDPTKDPIQDQTKDPIQDQNKEGEKTEREPTFLEKSPMDPQTFYALCDFLRMAVPQETCDGSLRLTLDFVREHKVDEFELLHWLSEYGGYCDCRVMRRVAPRFVFAMNPICMCEHDPRLKEDGD